jgi:hypothetical protein
MDEKTKNLLEILKKTLKVTDYNEKAVEALDNYIELRREYYKNLSDEDKNIFVNTLGRFLGECVINVYGGEWVESENFGWGVSFDERIKAFPFAKVHKQFENGAEDSVLMFFKTVPAILKEIKK